MHQNYLGGFLIKCNSLDSVRNIHEEMADVEIHVEEDKQPTSKQEMRNGSVRRDLTFNQSTFTDNLNAFYKTHRSKLFLLLKGILLVLYLGYVGYAFSVKFGDEGSYRLLVCTLFGLLFLSWRFIKRRHPGRILPNRCYIVWEEKVFRRVLRWILYIGVGGAAVAYTVVYSLIDHPENLMSLTGVVIFVVLMYITSTNRQKVKWHTLYWGLLIQLLLGIVFVSTDFGVSIMEYLSDRFTEFTIYADTGAAFVFSERYKEFQFVFQSMPRVLFFVTIINVLQYLGVITFLVTTIGGFLAFCLGTKSVESLVAASNIIMGTSEVFMTVRVYLNDLTVSELFALLVCGMASTAGSAMLVFQSFGVSMAHLLTASVMSAPAALVCSKLSIPEEDDDENVIKDKNKNEKKDVYIKDEEVSGSNNILEAITKGAQMGTMIVTSVVVTMMIFLSLVEFLNSTVEWFGNRVAIEDLTFEKICAYILWPVAFILGIPSQDCLIISRFLGIRGITNAGIAYVQMGQYIENNKQLSQYESIFNDTVHMENRDIFLPMWNVTLQDGILQDRSVIIGTYALCGFSCLPNIGVTLGILASIAPKRLNDVTKVAIRAFFVSTMASFLTACIAGLLYTTS